MPSEPTIVPPTPTIQQPSTPGDTSPGLEQVQKAFDRVLPEIKSRPLTPPPPAQQREQADQVAPQPVEKAQESVSPPSAPVEEHAIPSFLEEALKLEPSQVPTTSPAPPEVEVEWSEELPQEERKSRIKGLRDAYKAAKAELTHLRERPSRDPLDAQRLSQLETANRNMQEVLSRVGVENSPEFQNQVMAPLYASWNEAARIVRDAGADPQELAKAMSLNGRAQFEALDTLFSEMPESAKMEAHDALRSYRRFEDARRVAVANAPKTLEGIRQRETQAQYQQINQQREEMKSMFDRALTRLRDEAKVEVFQKTTDQNGDWWNKQGERLVEAGRNLFLENTDLDRVAYACLLAPAADAYRSLFIKSQKKVTDLQKFIKDRIGSEPTLSESGGNIASGSPEMKDDLKKPFVDVFLREFHRSQNRNR
jgi:hypothetical protein